MNRSARQESPVWSDREPAAKEHQAGSRSRRLLEGVLKKYTNFLQGWQSRYFVLDPELGQLQYHLSERSKNQRPPRGALPLLGAMVVSSSQFPHMFTVRSTNGDLYKLRALDAQEQEIWMAQLQLCSRRHSDCTAKVMMTQTEEEQKNLVNSTGPPHLRDPQQTSAATSSCLGRCFSMLQHSPVQTLHQNQNHVPSPLLCHSSAGLNQADIKLQPWSQRRGSTVTQVGPGSFRSSSLRATQFNENQSPKHSSDSEKHQNNHIQNQSWAADGSAGRSRPHPELQVKNGAQTPLSSSTQTLQDVDLQPESSSSPNHSGGTACQLNYQPGRTSSPDSLDFSEETTDTEDNEEEDLGVQEDQRSVIVHLLSQLKHGMDLTQVVLPTFILEKRSLLEMYANFMAHPDVFLSITCGRTPEERIIRFVEYYLTAFHEGRRGAVAKKPYNPILGESFHCSWKVPRDCVRPLRTTSCTGSISTSSTPGSSEKQSRTGRSNSSSSSSSRRNSDCYQVRFVAEQVSHHPPISCFYCESKEKRMCVNTYVWTKSKFMGMSVGVSMVGEGVLYLLEHDEEYVFTLPCAYARSILTVPWVELGGKVSINCAKSGYSATVTFHTKPFYGGKVHRVTAEVKHNQTGNTVCKAQGEWNGVLEFSYNNETSKVIDTSKLPIIKKRIRPLEKQGQYESRRLWRHVTASLKAGHMDSATEHKRCLEERQRCESRQRAASRAAWKPKYFIKEGEGWVYHSPLWKAD